DLSQPSREALNALLDDDYQNFLDVVADARGWTADQARAKVDEGPFLSQEAWEQGFVDSLLTEDQVEDLLPGGEDGPRVDLEDYVSHVHSGSAVSPRIALVFASGTIVAGKSGFDGLWGR